MHFQNEMLARNKVCEKMRLFLAEKIKSSFDALNLNIICAKADWS